MTKTISPLNKLNARNVFNVRSLLNGADVNCDICHSATSQDQFIIQYCRRRFLLRCISQNFIVACFAAFKRDETARTSDFEDSFYFT